MDIGILDGDIIAYQIAAYCEARSDGEEDLKQEIHDGVVNKARQWGSDCSEIVVAISSKVNYRKKILPSYKAHRKHTVPPVYREYAEECLRENFRWETIAGLEADDTLGIMASKSENVVAITIDKDLNQIPGWLINPNGAGFPTRVDKQQGLRIMLEQWLCGDSTDNLKGLMGTGPKKAPGVVNECWVEGDLCKTVENLLDHFPPLGTAEALMELNCIRILTHEDYKPNNIRLFYWGADGSIQYNFDHGEVDILA